MSDTPELFRLRVAYGKRGRLAYLGHLEVIHTVERIVRRAQLPYAVSRGFSPHMRVSFTAALPVGTSSSCEWFDLLLTELVPAPEALDRLVAASPAELAPVAARYVPVRAAALTASITRMAYRIELTPGQGSTLTASELACSLATVAARGQIPYRRGKKEKTLDLARTLVAWEVEPGAGDTLAVRLDTRCDNEGALRPEILLAACDRVLRTSEEPIVSAGVVELPAFARVRIERTGQYLEDEEGRLVDPLGGVGPEAGAAPLG